LGRKAARGGLEPAVADRSRNPALQRACMRLPADERDKAELVAMPALRGVDQVTIDELARVPRRVDQDHAVVGLPRRCGAQDREEGRGPRARADEAEVLGRRYVGLDQKSGWTDGR